MTFKEAHNFRMPFGKHKGRKLDEIAADDAGLKYLDWLVGEIQDGNVKNALEAYLGDPTIKAELKNL